MIDIVNTVICYNNAEENIEYAKSFFSLGGSESAALVVTVNKLDNYPIDQLRERLNIISSNIFICIPDENLGYMNGMLFGYSSYIKQNAKPQYVIMSNTDISYPDSSFLETLRTKRYNDDVWCIGPSVYVPSRDTYDNPVAVERFSKGQIERLVHIFRTPLLGSMYVYGASIKEKVNKHPEPGGTFAYQVHGCYFIVKSELADEMVLNPFRALLYSEESYVSEMVYHHNRKEYYDNELKICHNEHSVTGKLKYGIIAKRSAESMKVILEDFYE